MCRQSYNEKISPDLTATANFLNSVSDRRQNFSHKWVIFAIGPEWNLTKIQTILILIRKIISSLLSWWEGDFFLFLSVFPRVVNAWFIVFLPFRKILFAENWARCLYPPLLGRSGNQMILQTTEINYQAHRKYLSMEATIVSSWGLWNKAERLFTKCDANDLNLTTFVFTLFMVTITDITFRGEGSLVTTSPR